MPSQLEPLTDRQQEILAFIEEGIENDLPPTNGEIAAAFGFASRNAAYQHVKQLRKKGYLRTDSKALCRSIRVTDEVKRKMDGMPLLGVVAAGTMHKTMAIDDRINFVEVLTSKSRSQFALQVCGDSMTDAHIDDGDWVIVDKQNTAEPGQIVVAETEDGDSTLKYYFPENGGVRLQPANSKMKPIFAKSVRVRGVVSGVIRKLAG